MIEGEKEPLLFRIGVIHSGKKLPSGLVHRNQNAHFAPLAFARISPSEARGGMAIGDSGATRSEPSSTVACYGGWKPSRFGEIS